MMIVSLVKYFLIAFLLGMALCLAADVTPHYEVYNTMEQR